MEIYENLLETLGNTPLVKLDRYAPDGATVAVKLESFNPGSSVKDRIKSINSMSSVSISPPYLSPLSTLYSHILPFPPLPSPLPRHHRHGSLRSYNRGFPHSTHQNQLQPLGLGRSYS